MLANVSGPTKLLSLSICSDFDVSCCAKVCDVLHCSGLARPQCISTSAKEAERNVSRPSFNIRTTASTIAVAESTSVAGI